MVKDRTLLEKLAALEHDQWIAWAQSIIETEPDISEERRARWQQYFVPYENLTDEVKEHDRVWARKVIEVINNV
jgi:hypothetical protein